MQTKSKEKYARKFLQESYNLLVGTRKILQCAIHRFTYIYFNKNFLMENVDTSI